MGILEKIAEIEKEIARTQKNKGKNEQKRNVPFAPSLLHHVTLRSNSWSLMNK